MSAGTVGLIGVGLVGTALAERLHGAGWDVVGFDIDVERRSGLRRLTGQVAASERDVVTAADTIILSLPTSQIAASVIDSISDSLAGKTIIDTTTGEPTEMQALGQSLAEQRVHYLDATIAGSSSQVRSGEVVLMVGGEAHVVADCKLLLDTVANKVFHLGPWGAGARMKLVVNLVLGLNRAVLAEGLCFAERYGIDPRQALEVLQAGPAFSRVMETKAEKMLSGDFSPQARLAQHLKDVRLILSAGAEAGAKLPLSTLHAQLLDQLDRAGYGELDNSAIIKAFEKEIT
jgi:3-hydroxyisobutyrate dehydrogenase-like beta-hydroxyacid dehydrogenase